jgi:mannose-1-phosphate guanylyltransferase
MPSLYRGILRIRDNLGTRNAERVLREEFDGFESVSIDYGIMEKSEHIACLKPRVFWDDVGSWGALERLMKSDGRGNIESGNVVAVDTENSIVLGDDQSVIALVGMKNAIVVKEDDRILICHKDCDQRIKDALKKIAEREENLKYL